MLEFKYFLLIFISFAFGVYILSNVILPLFYTLPRIKKERTQGNLIKKIPIWMVLVSPFFWMCALILILYFIIVIYPEYIIYILLGLLLAFLRILIGLFRNDKNMNDDFLKTYKDYLKNE